MGQGRSHVGPATIVSDDDGAAAFAGVGLAAIGAGVFAAGACVRHGSVIGNLCIDDAIGAGALVESMLGETGGTVAALTTTAKPLQP